MRKILLGAVVTLLVMFGAVGGATADPGPNGNNDHGLCTAYFNGQKKGHDKHGSPGPFAALEEAGRNYTDNDGVDNDRDGDIDEEGESDSLSAAENVFNFCDNTTTIGGNPSHGRYDCKNDGSGDSDPNCERNPAPGNGKG